MPKRLFSYPDCLWQISTKVLSIRQNQFKITRSLKLVAMYSFCFLLRQFWIQWVIFTYKCTQHWHSSRTSLNKKCQMFSRYLKILRIRMKPIVINYQYQASYLSIQKGLLFQLIQTLQARRTQLQSTSGCKQSFNEVNWQEVQAFQARKMRLQSAMWLHSRQSDFLHDDHFFRNITVLSTFLLFLLLIH